MKIMMAGKFFNRPALSVSEALLGKYLCKGRQCFMITDVEAYVGPEDLASHASRGRTKRNEPMFGEPGIWYVYFTYGMHWMLNIVTGPKDFPAAVLIRGLASPAQQFARHGYFSAKKFLVLAPSRSQGLANYLRDSASSGNSKQIRLDGPAKLTKFLKINGRFNGKQANKKTGLWIEDRGIKIKKADILKRPRIGVGYAGAWKDKPYRLLLRSTFFT